MKMSHDGCLCSPCQTAREQDELEQKRATPTGRADVSCHACQPTELWTRWIGIIGTAGRGEDGKRLGWDTYCKMRDTTREYIRTNFERPYLGQSGGAPWADHIAVDLFLEGFLDNLILFLPCHFIIDPEFHGHKFDNINYYGQRLNQLHRWFNKVMRERNIREDSFTDIATAITEGAHIHVVPQGFLARNLLTGRCGALVSHTYGELTDGGTYHCWRHSLANKRKHFKIETL